MVFLRLLKWAFPLALTLFSVQSLAADRFDDDFEEKPWAEAELSLPPFPEEGNLIPFRVGATTDTVYQIDGRSLSVGPDGVVRYTVLVISPSGARNISYEGLRCATAERRLYAFGRSDKTWSKARSDQWVRIPGSSNNYQFELYRDYFCKYGPVGDADEARRILRSGG